MQDEQRAADCFSRAAVFAVLKHDGQTRDDGLTPYAVHVFRVTESLRRIAGERDEATLCAALLHDTIEDSNCTYEMISAIFEPKFGREFGREVAGIVAELTNDNRLPKEQRRAAMISHISKISTKAKRVKLADRLDNVTDLLGGSGSREKCERYIAETEKILEGCAGVCPPLEKSLVEALNELKYLVSRF